MRNYLTAIVVAAACLGVGIAALYAFGSFVGDAPTVQESRISDLQPGLLDTGQAAPEAPSFAPGPQTVDVSTTLGRAVTVLGLRIEPKDVVEDSRCPSGVACIQAGTVRVRVRLDDGTGGSLQVMTLGQPVVAGAVQVTLTSVEPNTAAGSAIDPVEYRFGFRAESR